MVGHSEGGGAREINGWRGGGGVGGGGGRGGGGGGGGGGLPPCVDRRLGELVREIEGVKWRLVHTQHQYTKV